MNPYKQSASLTALALASLFAAQGSAQAETKFSLGAALSAEDKAETSKPAPVRSEAFPQGTAPTTDFVLEADKLEKIFGFSAGEVDHHSTVPVRDDRVKEVDVKEGVFKADPTYKGGYDPEAQIEIYGGKTRVEPAPAALSIGRDELYGTGEVGEGIVLFGEKNRFFPHLLVFGDWRTAVAFNRNNGNEVGQIATRLNLFADLKLTATERILMFYEPLRNNGNATRLVFEDDKSNGASFEFEIEDEPTTLFFEGDAGAIIAGITDEFQTYDRPIAFGRVPLLFQNGVWLDDAFLGGAFTIPAQNSSTFDITNYDLTFFAAGAEVTTDAFVKDTGGNDDNEAAMIGVKGFFDMQEGYLELGAAYLHDKKQKDDDESYLNLTAAFSKRYFGKISNATRVILNVGQESPRQGKRTADGFVLISENALITHLPLTLIPYANFWLGKDAPQPAARGDGLLKNIGLAFETDALTGFPTLDAAGRDTFGGALGVQYLFALDQQLVVEAAAVIPWDGENGVAKDEQFALSARYQIPLSNQWILRADGIYGFLVDDQDVFGARMELRLKF